VIFFLPAAALAAPVPAPDFQLTILSTQTADRGLGQWGFFALIEAGGRRILFGTGSRPDRVLINTRELGIDLSSVEDVVLSHSTGIIPVV
jgi:7,8-dihydropterin-6-yl-methyl-4-(beta-D-ribofuranosyl)aminobenzene 5'-phosphate synthase